MSFSVTFGPVVLAAQRQAGKYDYLSVEVAYEGDYTGPKSFKGCSGGSLWLVDLKRNADGTVRVGDPILCGVPFYETGNDGGRGLIECHGSKSIYGVAVDSLLEDFSFPKLDRD